MLMNLSMLFDEESKAEKLKQRMHENNKHNK